MSTLKSDPQTPRGKSKYTAYFRKLFISIVQSTQNQYFIHHLHINILFQMHS